MTQYRSAEYFIHFNIKNFTVMFVKYWSIVVILGMLNSRFIWNRVVKRKGACVDCNASIPVMHANRQKRYMCAK